MLGFPWKSWCENIIDVSSSFTPTSGFPTHRENAKSLQEGGPLRAACAARLHWGMGSASLEAKGPEGPDLCAWSKSEKKKNGISNKNHQKLKMWSSKKDLSLQKPSFLKKKSVSWHLCRAQAHLILPWLLQNQSPLFCLSNWWKNSHSFSKGRKKTCLTNWWFLDTLWYYIIFQNVRVVFLK